MMVDAASAVGAAMLGAATVPEFVRLARGADVRGLSPLFVFLNAGGLMLLAIRSAHLGEIPFFLANSLGVLFWSYVAALQMRAMASGGARTHQSRTVLNDP